MSYSCVHDYMYVQLLHSVLVANAVAEGQTRCLMDNSISVTLVNPNSESDKSEL